MCPSGATCLSADCCSSEQALSNTNNRVGLVQSGHHHHLIENYYWKKCWVGVKQQSLILYPLMSNSLSILWREQMSSWRCQFCTGPTLWFAYYSDSSVVVEPTSISYKTNHCSTEAVIGCSFNIEHSRWTFEPLQNSRTEVVNAVRSIWNIRDEHSNHCRTAEQRW